MPPEGGYLGAEAHKPDGYILADSARSPDDKSLFALEYPFHGSIILYQY